MADRADQQQQAPEAAPGEQQEEVGFGAAFAERASDPGGVASKSQADGDEPSDKAPAEAGATEVPATTATETNASGTEEAPSDPWAGLTPEQLRQRLVESEAERTRLQASERSQRGRVGALTKKLNQRDRAAQATDQPEAKAGGDEDGESDLDKRIKHVADEYSDVVGPIAEALAAVRAEVADLKKAPAEAAEIEADTAAIAAEYEALEKAHPDYAQVAVDPNFKAWLKDKPAEFTALANEFDAKKVGSVITLFKAERSAATAGNGEGGDQGEKSSTATDDRRKRQLEGSRQVRGKSQPSAAGVPNDFSSAFKARAEAQQ